MSRAVLAALLLFAAPAAAQDTCKLTALGTGEVAAVRDGRTLALADGREGRRKGSERPGNRPAPCHLWIGAQRVRLVFLQQGWHPGLGPRDGDRAGRAGD